MVILKRSVWWFLAVLILHGCATSTPERDEVEPERPRPQAPSFEDTLLGDPMLDGVFVVPGTDFSQYDSIILTELNLEQWRPVGRELPLRDLNRNDRAFVTQEYTRAMVHYLTELGGYELSVDPGRSVLQVGASLHQAVQSAETDDRGAPRGTIVMLLNWELYDSVTGQLVATMTSRYPIDRSLNERNSPLTAMQVSRAFSRWAQWFRTELDALREDGQP